MNKFLATAVAAAFILTAPAAFAATTKSAPVSIHNAALKGHTVKVSKAKGKAKGHYKNHK